MHTDSDIEKNKQEMLDLSLKLEDFLFNLNGNKPTTPIEFLKELHKNSKNISKFVKFFLKDCVVTKEFKEQFKDSIPTFKEFRVSLNNFINMPIDENAKLLYNAVKEVEKYFEDYYNNSYDDQLVWVKPFGFDEIWAFLQNLPNIYNFDADNNHNKKSLSFYDNVETGVLNETSKKVKVRYKNNMLVDINQDNSKLIKYTGGKCTGIAAAIANNFLAP